MEYAEIFKVYGPLALGWPIAIYLGKFLLTRYESDIESRHKQAAALEALVKLIEEKK